MSGEDDVSKGGRPPSEPTEASRKGKQKFAKLRRMKCWPEVERRIKAGYPLKDIGRYIQDDREEYTNVRPKSLEKELSKYRDSLPAGEVVARHMPDAFMKKMKEFEEGTDELVYLDKLMGMQMERLEKMMEQLRKIDIWLPSQNMPRELDVARKLAYSRSQLKMDLGLSKRDMGKLTLESELVERAREKWGHEVAQTVSDPDSRKKVIDIMDHIRELKKVESRERHLRDFDDDEEENGS